METNLYNDKDFLHCRPDKLPRVGLDDFDWRYEHWRYSSPEIGTYKTVPLVYVSQDKSS